MSLFPSGVSQGSITKPKLCHITKKLVALQVLLSLLQKVTNSLLHWNRKQQGTQRYMLHSLCGLQEFQTVNRNMAGSAMNENCTCCSFLIKINVWQCDAKLINVSPPYRAVLVCTVEPTAVIINVFLGHFVPALMRRERLGGNVFEQISLIHWKNTVSIFATLQINLSDAMNEPPC